ncbi:MAG: hypothetical protein EOP34_02985 [Rickettsiales bacterium]|nr:MAG: hypothetical protein EOP34_02985 [Rickettsiales bacterium]
MFFVFTLLLSCVETNRSEKFEEIHNSPLCHFTGLYPTSYFYLGVCDKYKKLSCCNNEIINNIVIDPFKYIDNIAHDCKKNVMDIMCYILCDPYIDFFLQFNDNDIYICKECSEKIYYDCFQHINYTLRSTHFSKISNSATFSSLFFGFKEVINSTTCYSC